MKHLFIVNPVAGKLAPDKKIARIREGLAAAPQQLKDGADMEIYTTSAPMDACAKVRAEAAETEELRVYACGGDGTLNECVNGAAGLANVAVTHFPCGTGNDFIKTYGEDAKRFFDLSQLLGGEVRPVDLIDCNGRKSISICSVGIDARVGGDVHKYSDLPLVGGACGYVVSLLTNYIKGISSTMRVKIGNLTFGPKLNMVCLCNGRYYGGGFNPLPDAMPDDGVMDVLVVSGVNRLNFVTAILGYAKGQYEKYPQYISRLAADELTIDTDAKEVVNIDGEVMRTDHMEFKLEKAAVNFIFPRNMRYFEGR